MMLNMDDRTFSHYFRVTKPQFEYIMMKLQDNGIQKQHSQGLPVPATKKVLMFLWYMANQNSFREMSDKFDVSQSTTHRIILQVLNIMCTIGSSFISWPNTCEKAASAAAFQHLCGLSGVICAIDGCHIRVQRPPIRGGDYMNRKSFYSVLLQGIVDVCVGAVWVLEQEAASAGGAVTAEGPSTSGRLISSPAHVPTTGKTMSCCPARRSSISPKNWKRMVPFPVALLLSFIFL